MVVTKDTVSGWPQAIGKGWGIAGRTSGDASIK